MKQTESQKRKPLQLFNTPIKRVVAIAMATVIGVGSVVSVMATTGKATIYDNDVAYRVNLSTTDTKELLDRANIQVGEADIVERDDTNGVVIRVRRPMDTTVEADGTQTVVSAHYGDLITSVMEKAGVALDENDVLDTDRNGTLTMQDRLVVTRYHKVTVWDNGVAQTTDVPEGPVENVIDAANLTLGKEDTLSEDLQTRLYDGMELAVNRVTYATQTVTEVLPFETREVKTDNLYQGETEFQTEGVNGSKTAVKECKFVNGQLVEATDVVVLAETAPVEAIKLVGTKARPVAKKTAVQAAPVVVNGSTIQDANGNVLQVARVLRGSCTAYTGGGITSTGAPAAVGRVAVNPNVIPYGTRLYIASPDGSIVYGYAIAADTGGALLSGQALVDLYYDTLSECINFGRRQMDVYILA